MDGGKNMKTSNKKISNMKKSKKNTLQMMNTSQDLNIWK